MAQTPKAPDVLVRDCRNLTRRCLTAEGTRADLDEALTSFELLPQQYPGRAGLTAELIGVIGARELLTEPAYCRRAADLADVVDADPSAWPENWRQLATVVRAMHAMSFAGADPSVPFDSAKALAMVADLESADLDPAVASSVDLLATLLRLVDRHGNDDATIHRMLGDDLRRAVAGLEASADSDEDEALLLPIQIVATFYEADLAGRRRDFALAQRILRRAAEMNERLRATDPEQAAHLDAVLAVAGTFEEVMGDGGFAAMTAEQATAMERADQNVRDVMASTIEHGLCKAAGLPGECGGSTIFSQARILADFGVPARTERCESVDDLAARLEEGRGVIAAVNAGALDGDANRLWGGRSPNHAVVPIAVAREPADGHIQGFYVNDSATDQGPRFVDAETMARAWLRAGGHLGAALRSRLRSLTLGTKGMALDTRRSVPVEDVFAQPCVIELRNFGDDEEKSFVMALLLCQLYEYAESRSPGGPARGGLRHLTLIEEAHRLLSGTRPPSGGESADAQAKAVAMFTDMLAEMRAYGEGFVVADQVPAKLAPEILKNSAVKILHRLVAADDRSSVAAMTGLTDGQSRHLANLAPGTAVVHDEQIGSPVLVRIERVEWDERSEPAAPPAARESGRTGYLEQNGGCRKCPAPCTFLHLFQGPGVLPAMDAGLAPFFARVLVGDADQAWTAWEAWRGSGPVRSPGPGGPPDGAVYCAFSQAGYRWLGLVSGLPGSADPGRTAEAGGTAAAGDLAERLLARDRAARSLARFGAGWLAADGLTEAAAALFDELVLDLGRMVVSRPPVELAGCDLCPSRCRALPVLSPVLPVYANPVAACASRPLPVESRLRQLGEAASAVPGVGDLIRQEPSRKRLLYCMVVTAAARAAAERGGDAPEEETAAVADLLAVLRE